MPSVDESSAAALMLRSGSGRLSLAMEHRDGSITRNAPPINPGGATKMEAHGESSGGDSGGELTTVWSVRVMPHHGGSVRVMPHHL